MSALLVLPTIMVKDSFVDFNSCGLMPQNYGMIIYVSVMLFILPATVLVPIFIRFTNLNKQFHIRRDMSSDFLDDRDDEGLYGDNCGICSEIQYCPECSAMGMGQFSICKLKK